MIYTDGACSGNPGPGGWAWIRPDGPFAAGPDPDTTNQRMELAAVLEGLRAADGPAHVISDSTYVVNCFRDKWWEGWLRRDWKNAQKKPVANRDLWEPLIEVVRGGDVTFEWVKGHAGDRWNDYADRLAVEAAFTQSHRSGDTTPTEIGEPDRVDRRPAAAPASPRRDPTGREAPAGRGLVVAGLRTLPSDVDELERTVAEIIAAKAELHDDLVVLSGLRAGAEELGARAALRAGVPLVAVLPYPDPARAWTGDARRRFDDLVGAASEVIVLQTKTPADRKGALGALAPARRVVRPQRGRSAGDLGSRRRRRRTSGALVRERAGRTRRLGARPEPTLNAPRCTAAAAVVR